MLVHVGYKKCGSTWLQRNLFNRTDRGFFPIAPNQKKDDTQRSKYLGDYFVFDANGYLLDPFSNRTDEVKKLVEELLSGVGNKIPVTSCERLCGQAHAAGFDAAIIAERIADALPDAKILIIVREQISVAVSLYFQYLKAGGHRHYRHYFAPPTDRVRPGFAPSYFEYHKLISHYQSVFGSQNVLCLPLEQLLLEPGVFVEKLRNFTGADIPNDLPFDKREKAGSNRAVEIKTRYLNLLKRPHSLNGFALDTPKSSEHAVAFIRDKISKLVPEGYEQKMIAKIRSDVAELLGDHYRDSNRKTEQLIGLPLREKFGYM
jgi:hypothetical protein